MRKSNKERILDYLKNNKTITGLECQLKLGILEYRHPIMELRNEGYNITGKMTTNKNTGAIYKTYTLEEK